MSADTTLGRQPTVGDLAEAVDKATEQLRMLQDLTLDVADASNRQAVAIHDDELAGLSGQLVHATVTGTELSGAIANNRRREMTLAELFHQEPDAAILALLDGRTANVAQLPRPEGRRGKKATREGFLGLPAKEQRERLEEQHPAIRELFETLRAERQQTFVPASVIEAVVIHRGDKGPLDLSANPNFLGQRMKILREIYGQREIGSHKGGSTGRPTLLTTDGLVRLLSLIHAQESHQSMKWGLRSDVIPEDLVDDLVENLKKKQGSSKK